MSRSPARPRAALLVITLTFLAACSSSPETSGYGDPSLLPSGSASASKRPSGTPSTSRSPMGRATTTGQPTGSGGGVSYDDDGAVGRMAKPYLRGSPARRMVVEIDYVAGRAPSKGSMDHLLQILRRETSKADGVSIDLDDEIPAGRDSHSFEQIEALERRYRDRHSDGATATAYLLFLNGDMQDEEGTLGVSYRASSAALFADRIDGAATAIVQPGAIERAVVVHEMGHLLGLVNLGFVSRYDREDPDHPKHSKYKDSVMYWAVEDVSVAALLTGGPPSDFDRFDRADLARLRG